MFYSPITEEDKQQIFNELKIESVNDLFSDLPSIGNEIKNLPEAQSELELKKSIKKIGSQNMPIKDYISFLGGGSYEHFIPSVISHITSRSEFYTAYTPYQAEISQGTLRAIFEFQTMVCELMGLDISNASLYDGATALAESCIMAHRETKKSKILVPAQLSPNYINVLNSYLIPKNIEVDIFHSEHFHHTNIENLAKQLSKDEYAAVVLPYPDFFGNIYDYTETIKQAKSLGITTIFSCDPIALALFKSPGEYDADIAVAEGQPLGIPHYFGGPYLGLMAAKDKYVRLIPGRVVGKSTDAKGNDGYLLTFQTREQHIRREKALSNICSNQALIALAATVYMGYMGPTGIRKVAESCYKKCEYLKQNISKLPGYKVLNKDLTFKEIAISLPQSSKKTLAKLKKKNILGGIALSNYYKNADNILLIAVTEMRSKADIDLLIESLKEI
jgi:glycine dehydrogenase subunit 1